MPASPAGPPLRWPCVVAHRGASAHHPENTLAAFDAAVRAGADAVELDVRRSADGVLVVLHDAEVSRTTDGRGYVAELPLERLRRFAPPIPTLAEALDLLAGRAAVEVEIKNAPGEPGYEPAAGTTVRALVEELRRRRSPRAFVASFDGECLAAAARADPRLPTGLLVDGRADLARSLEAAAGRHGLLLPEAAALEAAGSALVGDAHARGVALCAWTVNDADAIERLFRLGVDAVETDDPALGAAARARVSARP